MEGQKMKFLVVFLFILSSCDKGHNSKWADYAEALDDETQAMTAEFMMLVNNHRRELGLTGLILDEGLENIAKIHSMEMANGEVPFGHDGFSERCIEGRSVIGGGNLCSENVAMGQKTPLSVYTAWMNSAGHRANIEQSRVTHTGFGYQQNQNGTYYWTQIFLESD
jgi:uncharacterized protein YkwD